MDKLLAVRCRDGILQARMRGRKVLELCYEPEGVQRQVGDIFLGRVMQVSPGTSAAFVELAPGENAFCPYREEDRPRPGEIFPVQLIQDAVKTKLPSVSRYLSFPGRFLVLEEKRKGVFVSRKISGDAERERLRLLLADRAEAFGWIVRTNGGEASETELLQEADSLTAARQKVYGAAQHRLPGTKLRSAASAALTALRDARGGEIEEWVTDDAALYADAVSFCEAENISLPLRLYENASLPLAKLYSLETALEKASGRRVWLRSGGYLVIDCTEALTVIDVNTGKSSCGDFERNVTETNLEAAREAAAQLRLRNISGMIVIDFINMSREEDREAVRSCLQAAAAEDPVPVHVEGFTRLGLMELTREKKRRSLREQLSAAGPATEKTDKE